MKYLLLLWPLAGIAFWAVYEAKFFLAYPFQTAGMLLGCAAIGPLTWLTLLIHII